MWRVVLHNVGTAEVELWRALWTGPREAAVGRTDRLWTVIHVLWRKHCISNEGNSANGIEIGYYTTY